MEKVKNFVSTLIIRILHGLGLLWALNILFGFTFTFDLKNITAATLLAIFFA
jgi:hypothetical protein